MTIKEYIRQRNAKHRAEIKALEEKAAENSEKAEALSIILGEDGGEDDGGNEDPA